MKFLAWFFVLFISLTHAQTNQLKGKFETKSSKGPVRFVLNWQEEDEKISGSYRDNFFIKEAEVTGHVDETGRTFVVSLPEASKGVRSIFILTSKAQGTKAEGVLPASVVLRARDGTPVDNTRTRASFVALPPEEPEKKVVTEREEVREECGQDFGALSEYCGRYGGIISEEIDETNSCNLLSQDNVRLELETDRDLLLQLGFVDPIVVNNPVHEIGKINLKPDDTSIDVTSRSCGPLPGTLLPKGPRDCKILNLFGRFKLVRGDPHFTGIYTIYDLNTKRLCRYSLSLDRLSEID